MKKILFLLCFAFIGLQTFGQALNPLQNGTINYDPISIRKRQAGTDTTTQTLTMNYAAQLYQPKSYEFDSARNYTFSGSAFCWIKWGHRDTINLVPGNYTPYSKFTFFSTYNAADTTILIPTSGKINGATGAADTLSLNGTNASISLYTDGVNFWPVK